MKNTEILKSLKTKTLSSYFYYFNVKLVLTEQHSALLCNICCCLIWLEWSSLQNILEIALKFWQDCFDLFLI